VDTNKSALVHLKKLAIYDELVSADAKMPFRPGLFDTIIAIETLAYIRENEFISRLKEIEKLAQGNALFLFSGHFSYQQIFQLRKRGYKVIEVYGRGLFFMQDVYLPTIKRLGKIGYFCVRLLRVAHLLLKKKYFIIYRHAGNLKKF
jgi:hypothetical protein